MAWRWYRQHRLEAGDSVGRSVLAVSITPAAVLRSARHTRHTVNPSMFGNHHVEDATNPVATTRSKRQRAVAVVWPGRVVALQTRAPGSWSIAIARPVIVGDQDRCAHPTHSDVF